MDLIDVYRAFHPKTREYTFFSSACGHSPGLIICWATERVSVNLRKLKLYQASFLTTILWNRKTTRKKSKKHKHTEAKQYAAAAKSLQSWPTLCDLIDGSPPGSAIPGILQARTLEWVAISFSSAWKWKVKMKSLSGVRLFVTPWTAAHQAPRSLGFSRQEHWSGLPFPVPNAWKWSRSVVSNS